MFRYVNLFKYYGEVNFFKSQKTKKKLKQTITSEFTERQINEL